MERRDIPILDLGRDAAALFLSGTTVDIDHGMRVQNPAVGSLLLCVSNAGASPGVVTVSAGNPAVATLSELGDFSVSIPAGESKFIGPLNRHRFEQTDSWIWVDCSPELAARIAAYVVHPSVAGLHH